MADNNPRPPVVLISATGAEATQPSVLEFSQFLYHVHLSSVIARLATDPKYASFEFPRYTFTPQTARLQRQDRLVLEAVRHESPWTLKSSLVAIGAVAPTLWLLAQTFEKIGTYDLNLQKVRAEIQETQTRTRSEKLSNIEKATQLQVPLTKDEIEATLPQRGHGVLKPVETEMLRKMLAERRASEFYARSQHTLQALPFRVRELHFEVVEKESKNGKK